MISLIKSPAILLIVAPLLCATSTVSSPAFVPEDAGSVDPCSVLCYIHLTNCEGVVDYKGVCKNLFKDAQFNVAVGATPPAGYTAVTREAAMNYVSVKPEDCPIICESTENCTVSYCKANNHCKGLYWDDFKKRASCFFSPSTPCNRSVPVMCKYSSAPTVAATTTKLSSPATAPKAAKTVAVQKSSGEDTDGSVESEGGLDNKSSSTSKPSSKAGSPATAQNAGKPTAKIAAVPNVVNATETNVTNTPIDGLVLQASNSTSTTKSAIIPSTHFMIICSMYVMGVMM